MKVIVAHSGWQHSAHLALALQKADLLDSYVTTVYDTPQSFLISFLKKIPSRTFRQGVTTRKSEKLDENKVITYCTFSGVVSIVLSRLGWRHLYQLNEKQLNKRFGKKVAKLAVREHADVLVMYEGKAAGAFKWLSRHNPGIVRIIDSASACSIFVGKKMAEEFSAVGSHEPFFSSLLLEGGDENEVVKEIQLADRYLVASEYVKHSFVSCGLDSDKVMVCAYGGNFPIKNEPKIAPSDRPVRFVYCGRCTPQKGVHHLLEAFRGRTAQLRLVGIYDQADSYLARWTREPNIQFIGKVTHDQVVEHLDWADVFIFPSLTDGLSLASAEAICRGLPVVCTDRTGINDYIENGVNGFVVPAGDTGVLEEKIDWFASNSEQIPTMSIAALETARKLTWNRYDDEIGRLFWDTLNGAQKEVRQNGRI